MTESTTTIVKTTGLSVYQESTKILSDVNIKLIPGEFVYFIGKVGSGKSSLLKALYAELPIIEGEAEVADHNLTEIRSKDIPLLRRKIGMVFQDFELMSDRSVYDNLKFVLKATDWKIMSEIDDRINEVLSKVGMLDKINSMPAKLSGGEKQSISIARALLNNPPIIFADEPTGNLDPDSASQIMNILYSLTDTGKSVIMVTHNYNILKKYPGRVYNFDNGKVIEEYEEGIELTDL